MRFQVPQFIEVEDKIFGPLTLRQFIYLAGAVGIGIISWALLPHFIALLIGGPVVGLGIALAFVKINDRSFITVLESAFTYSTKKHLYIWKKREQKAVPKERREEEKEALLKVPSVSGNRLKDLAWSLDIKESIYSDRKQQK